MKDYSAVQLNLDVVISEVEVMLDAFPIELADPSILLGTKAALRDDVLRDAGMVVGVEVFRGTPLELLEALRPVEEDLYDIMVRDDTSDVAPATALEVPKILDAGEGKARYPQFDMVELRRVVDRIGSVVP